MHQKHLKKPALFLLAFLLGGCSSSAGMFVSQKEQIVEIFLEENPQVAMENELIQEYLFDTAPEKIQSTLAVFLNGLRKLDFETMNTCLEEGSPLWEQMNSLSSFLAFMRSLDENDFFSAEQKSKIARLNEFLSQDLSLFFEKSVQTWTIEDIDFQGTAALATLSVEGIQGNIQILDSLFQAMKEGFTAYGFSLEALEKGLESMKNLLESDTLATGESTVTVRFRLNDSLWMIESSPFFSQLWEEQP